jgi:hypothetical protein
VTGPQDLIGRGEAIAMLAGEELHPQGKGRGGYWRWYQRLERERKSGRLKSHSQAGRREVYFARGDIDRLATELRGTALTTRASRRRAKHALRERMEQQGLVSLPAAATQLGLKPASLRSRLQRGTIEGERIDGQWFLRPEAIAAARKRRAPRGSRLTVRCELCGAEREKTASQARGSERHFCSDAHRLEWLREETTAKRITRRGRPDGPEGRRRKSEATKRRWENGELDPEQIRQLGDATTNRQHWTRSKKKFPEGVDKMARNRYGHGLSEERKGELARRAHSKASLGSDRSRETRALEARVAELWRAPLTQMEIANMCHVSPGRVSQVAKELGLPPRRRGRPSGNV